LRGSKCDTGKARCACRRRCHRDSCEPGCGWRRHRKRRLLCRLLLTWLFAGAIFAGRPLLKRLIGELFGDKDKGPSSAGRTRPATGEKQTIPATIYRRPDPMIYDQYYLRSLGLAVTWDNPDIHLERPLGTPVSSHDLAPKTDYHVIARIWNLSEKAAAPHLPVQVSYLTFGVGTKKTTFAETTVNLPVKGSPGLPVYADVVWTTPPDPGHYCLQVELIWPPADDENPNNNLGQHNTDVKALHSPATFQFPVRNDHLSRTRRITLVADAYEIPPPPACDDDAQRGQAAGRHDPRSFAVPEGWQVEILPSELALEPQQEELVSVTIRAPDGFTGRRPFNVNAFDGAELLGGVTLYVDGA
jgi:hypothetical protein